MINDDEFDDLVFDMDEGVLVSRHKKTNTRELAGKFFRSDLEDAMLYYFTSKREAQKFVRGYFELMSEGIATNERFDFMRLGETTFEDRKGAERGAVAEQGRASKEARRVKFRLHYWIRDKIRSYNRLRHDQ